MEKELLIYRRKIKLGLFLKTGQKQSGKREKNRKNVRKHNGILKIHKRRKITIVF